MRQLDLVSFWRAGGFAAQSLVALHHRCTTTKGCSIKAHSNLSLPSQKSIFLGKTFQGQITGLAFLTRLLVLPSQFLMGSTALAEVTSEC